MKEIIIRCPNCNWEPDENCRWMCSVCNTVWNTFETHGKCPSCGKVYEETICLTRRGGCGKISPHADWYEEKEIVIAKPSFDLFKFWVKKDKLPVTETDKEWIENALLLLSEMFDPTFFKSLVTITPDREYFDWNFTGGDEDAEFVLERLVEIMHIDAWEIQLMFYSNRPTSFSEGIVATPSEKLKGSWKSTSGEYVNKGLGQKEIRIEMDLLKNPVSLISTMAHELAHYKLLGEGRMDENDEHLTDLTAVAFGLGIFKGNSYFKFGQWTGTTHQSWQMQKKGYLPEQMIAYAMAWLAHYRTEDISWKKYLNKTMKKYFEQSYQYIIDNPDKVRLS